MSSSDALSTYRSMRKLAQSGEPDGDAASQGGEGLFVVQRHDASRLHYDFRLELDGVLKSWAVPKGVSDDPQDKRLAVEVEDHPLDYARFEGEIPKGHYGAGTVERWDIGSWAPLHDPRKGLAEGKLHFVLVGERYQGEWVLIRTRPSGKQKQWLLRKVGDGQAALDKLAGMLETPAPQSQSLPEVGSVQAQLATVADDVPGHGRWAYEVKYDGYRMLCRLQDGQPRFYSRNAGDWTDKLGGLADRIAERDLGTGWLDGEVVALSERGVPDFQTLQAALDGQAQDLIYIAFDVLFWEGVDLRQESFDARRQILETVMLPAQGSNWLRQSEVMLPDSISQVRAWWRQAGELGLEGLIGKSRDSVYSGKRSGQWIKLKCRPEQEMVIGGFTRPEGARKGLGALLVGVYDGDVLRYAGRVGTGFNNETLSRLTAKLTALKTEHNPFDSEDAKAPTRWRKEVGQIVWVKPQLVAQVAFAEWTQQGLLRQAAFLGLRDDKPARAVVREGAAPPSSGKAAGQTQDTRPTRRASGSNRKASPKAANRPATGSGNRVAGVAISHPERVIFEDAGVTKLDLARYYASVADAILPHLQGRRLSLLRCPQGTGGTCFFQKHIGENHIEGVDMSDDAIRVENVQGMIELVQRGVIEFHTWGSREPRIEQADRITLDLDPGEGVSWRQVAQAAQLARELFQALGLTSFVKTTGGKGLHVVAPLKPKHEWETVRAFSKALADHLAAVFPDRFVANMAKARRKNKIFVDYLRNAHEATAVAAFSARARAHAPVSMPIAWSALTKDADPRESAIHLGNAAAHVAAAQRAWSTYEKSRSTLTVAALGAMDLR